VDTVEHGSVDGLYAAAAADFERYEIIKDVVDECIDLTLNYRQSGHPGGSRSKVLKGSVSSIRGRCHQ